MLLKIIHGLICVPFVLQIIYSCQISLIRHLISHITIIINVINTWWFISDCRRPATPSELLLKTSYSVFLSFSDLLIMQCLYDLYDKPTKPNIPKQTNVHLFLLISSICDHRMCNVRSDCVL